MDDTPARPGENLAHQVDQPIGHQESISTNIQTNQQSKITSIIAYCFAYTYVCMYIRMYMSVKVPSKYAYSTVCKTPSYVCSY